MNESDRQVFDSPRVENSWSGLPFLMGIGLFLRVLVIFFSEKSFHPDEIFQYLEQAHRLVFGYGVIPWEYAHGTRNWLLPGLIALVLAGCRWLGLDDPHFYIPVIESLACVASISVIYCAYWIGRQIVSESVGRMAALVTCFWYETIIFAHKVTPEIFGAYLLLGGLVCILRRGTNRTALLAGICCSGAADLRIQYIPAVVVAVCLLYSQWQKEKWSPRQIAIAASGGIAVVIFAGWLDYYAWGTFFISFYNNYVYNTIYGVSKLWGEDPWWFYLGRLVYASAGLFGFGILNGLLRRGRKQYILLALLFAVVLPHSLIAHKEYRFIFLSIPICLLLVAIAIEDLWQDNLLWQKYNPGKIAIRMGAILSAYGLASTLFYNDGGLAAYLYLNNQPEVVAVLNLETDWPGSGGYYYLHKDIPVYFSEHLEAIDISQERLSRYVSHIVCKTRLEPVPGFTALARFGTVEVRVAESPPSESLNLSTHRYLQEGVDDLYEPTVVPRI